METRPTIDVFVLKYAFFVFLDYRWHLLMSNGTTVGYVVFYTLLKSK